MNHILKILFSKRISSNIILMFGLLLANFCFEAVPDGGGGAYSSNLFCYKVTLVEREFRTKITI